MPLPGTGKHCNKRRPMSKQDVTSFNQWELTYIMKIQENCTSMQGETVIFDDEECSPKSDHQSYKFTDA